MLFDNRRYKIIFRSGILSGLVFGLISCSDHHHIPSTTANVYVTVRDSLDVLQPGATVYMYKDVQVTSSTSPSDAVMNVIADTHAVALFGLNFADLGIIESQTSLTFVVFYMFDKEVFVAGKSAPLTLRGGEIKHISILVPN